MPRECIYVDVLLACYLYIVNVNFIVQNRSREEKLGCYVDIPTYSYFASASIHVQEVLQRWHHMVLFFT